MMVEYKDNNKQCFKCKSENIEFKEMKKSTCKCGAIKHFKKKCKECGFESIIHRSLVLNSRPKGVDG